MNCLEYALDFWDKNPGYGIFTNEDHYVNLPAGQDYSGIGFLDVNRSDPARIMKQFYGNHWWHKEDLYPVSDKLYKYVYGDLGFINIPRKSEPLKFYFGRNGLEQVREVFRREFEKEFGVQVFTGDNKDGDVESKK